MVGQTLRPRAGFSGLTYRSCSKWNKDNECELYEVINYDLHNPETRKQLHDFEFICSVNGKRYYVCADKPALCRNEFSGFFGKKKVVHEIPITNIEYLINAATECHSQ